MKLNLVNGGIFPIKGKLNEDSTGFQYSGTFQGEGKLTGTACLFIRTSACNLRCAWVGLDGNGSLCDTPYSSHNPEKNQMEVEDIVKIVVENTREQNINHVVISGGEPTMQTDALANPPITFTDSVTWNEFFGFSLSGGDITSVIAGSGLVGGGFTGSVTLNIGAGDGISVSANAVSVDTGSSHFQDGVQYIISSGSYIIDSGLI